MLNIIIETFDAVLHCKLLDIVTCLCDECVVASEAYLFTWSMFCCCCHHRLELELEV